MAVVVSQEDFMSEVREYRCLYDKNCRDFKDKRTKANAWKAVADKFSISPSEAEGRYKNIRTVFTRYVRNVKPPSGSGRDAVVLRPDYEHLRWLIVHIKLRDSVTNDNIIMTPDHPTKRKHGSNSAGGDDADDDTTSVAVPETVGDDEDRDNQIYAGWLLITKLTTAGGFFIIIIIYY